MRWSRDLGNGTLTIERIHPATSLLPGAADGSEPAAWIRGHRRTENQPHHACDHTFHEHAAKIRTPHPPRDKAGLRNPVTSVHRQDRYTNTATALPATPAETTHVPHHPRPGITNPDTRSLLKDPGLGEEWCGCAAGPASGPDIELSNG
ncbi:hypothetical protein [Streptomyces olivaceus]|uniref:hypothetical protein n=1 Tax=Streptomyces olivaceus TaxID=47716 RepID=UPI004055B882